MGISGEKKTFYSQRVLIGYNIELANLVVYRVFSNDVTEAMLEE